MPILQPSIRVRLVHDRPPNTGAPYVLYWMIGARRPWWNFALDRAVDWARALGKPLVVLEALRADHRWASDRIHRFVLAGMCDNQTAFRGLGVAYHPYVEPHGRAGRGLLETLAGSAAVVVTDRMPVFDLPDLVHRASRHVTVRFEEVDGSGLVPLDEPPEGVVFPTAYAFRRYLQRTLPVLLRSRPRPQSLARGDLPQAPALSPLIHERWPAASPALLEGRESLVSLPIDHRVAPVDLPGGAVAGRQRLVTFVNERLAGYAEARNHPDADACSGLSPYLHFGHVSAHEVAARLLRHEGWKPDRLADHATGAKEGWWGASADAEAFLDQVVTWRELGFNTCARRADYAEYDSLPGWAIATLNRHASDRRPSVYTLDQFARAETHDPVWNAAQWQLTVEGRIHSYLRMLWGKKILEWTASPRDALAVMIELNNRLALDGRDPNSYSGIFWVLGRYDRPWPERPIYGTVRTMTSASTVKKLRMKEYLRRFQRSADGLPWDDASGSASRRST